MAMTADNDQHGADGRRVVFIGGRVEPELVIGLSKLAKENDRSVSAELRLAVRHWLGMSGEARARVTVEL